MTDITLAANKREISGRKVKRLREQGLLPANIFGNKVESQAIQLDNLEFKKVLSEAGETTLIQLSVDGKVRPVLISNVQTDPIFNEPIHVDFHQVNLKEKVTAQVPVELVGESPAEKQGLGTVVQYIDELEVEALPTDLPESFEINVEELVEVDQSIFVKDVKTVSDKVEIQNDSEQIIAKVEPPREEETVEVDEGDEAAEESEADESSTEDQSESASEE